MQRAEINKLYHLLKKDFQKSKRRYITIQKSAAEIARVAANSPSQSGDRFHSQGQADIAKSSLDNLELLISDIKKVFQDEIPTQIKPPCYVKIDYGDRGISEMFVVNYPTDASGVKLVSSSSPLGEALLGKSVGESIVFNGTNLEIIKIE